MREPTQIDWARLAAYIDGEGSITIARYKSEKRAGQIAMWIMVAVANTDPRLPLWLKETFGGNMPKSGERRSPRHKDRFNWQVSCSVAAKILRGCLPYFILKRDQAEIALAFQETVGNVGQRITEEVLLKRESYRQQILGSHRMQTERLAGYETTWHKPKSPPGRKPWKNIPTPAVQ